MLDVQKAICSLELVHHKLKKNEKVNLLTSRVQTLLTLCIALLLVSLVTALLMDLHSRKTRKRSKILATRHEVWTLAIVVDAVFEKTGRYLDEQSPNSSAKNYFVINSLLGDLLFEDWRSSKKGSATFVL